MFDLVLIKKVYVAVAMSVAVQVPNDPSVLEGMEPDRVTRHTEEADLTRKECVARSGGHYYLVTYSGDNSKVWLGRYECIPSD